MAGVCLNKRETESNYFIKHIDSYRYIGTRYTYTEYNLHILENKRRK